MRNDDVEDVFRMDVKTLLHIFPLQSTATGESTVRSWHNGGDRLCIIETGYVFTQGGCQVSTRFKIVPAVINLD
jgi:hypothetical protein